MIRACASALISVFLAASAGEEKAIVLSGGVLGASGKHALYVALWKAQGFLKRPAQSTRFAAGEDTAFCFEVTAGRWALSARGRERQRVCSVQTSRADSRDRFMDGEPALRRRGHGNQPRHDRCRHSAGVAHRPADRPPFRSGSDLAAVRFRLFLSASRALSRLFLLRVVRHDLRTEGGAPSSLQSNQIELCWSR